MRSIVLIISLILLVAVDSAIAQTKDTSDSSSKSRLHKGVVISDSLAFRHDFPMGWREPLIVIDGLPFVPPPFATADAIALFKNPFRRINPEDIESITILKDKTASILYGEQAKWGVVVVTTKKKNKVPKKF